MQKVKVNGHSVQMLRVETDGQTDGRTDEGNCITSHANAVGNRHKLKCVHLSWNIKYVLRIRNNCTCAYFTGYLNEYNHSSLVCDTMCNINVLASETVYPIICER